MYIYTYGVGESNIVKYKNAYYAGTFSTTNESKAINVSANSTIEFYFPIYEMLSGKISFADGVTIEGVNGKGLDIELTLRPKNGASWQYKTLENVTNTNAIAFSFPVNEGETYILSAKIVNKTGAISNLPTGTDYYYSTDKATTKQADATIISCLDTVNLEFSKLNTITGKINVSGTYKYLSPITSVKAVLQRQSGSGTSYYSTTAYIDSNFNYIATFDDTLDGEYTLCLNFSGTSSNVVGKNYYYHTGEETKSNISIKPGTDITSRNIDVETGYVIEGKIKLPKDAQITNVTYSPKVYLNSSYYCECEPISAENKEARFMVAAPSDVTGARPYATLPSSQRSGEWYSNMYEKDVYYVSNTESTYESTMSTLLKMNRDHTGLVLELKTAAIVNLQINRPEEFTSYFYGYLYVTDTAGTQLGSTSFSISQDTPSTNVRIPVSKSYIGDSVYVYYAVSTTSEYIQPGNVYVNPDGTYTTLKSQRKTHTLKETQTINFNVQTPEEIVFPDYILESDHPYGDNLNKSYIYEYPDKNATSLKVTFSEDSYMGYSDYVTIQNADGTEIINQYSGTKFYDDDLAGRTVTVYGNKFTVNFVTNGTTTSDFGWAVTKVEPRYAIVESKHPYKEDLTYEYTHPTEVESLAITFDEDSNIESYNYLYIYDKNENLLHRLSGNLADKTYEIPGSYFKMVLDGNSSTSKYGIAVTHITEAIYYDVTFLDYDGTILETLSVPIKRSAVYPNELPIRPASGKKTYTFTGWDKDLSSVTESMYTYAQYSVENDYIQSEHPYNTKEEVIKYNYVHNKDADGLSITFSHKTAWSFERAILYLYDSSNSNPVIIADEGSDISGKTFNISGTSFRIEFKPLSNYNSEYGFKIENIEGTYTTPRYTVKYLNYDGRVLYETKVKEGEPLSIPEATPFEGYKNGVEYDFIDWDIPSTIVTGDMTIYPRYNKVEYTKIYTEEDLNNIRNDLSGKYILMNDITLENPWTPIGSLNFNGTNAFTGIIDGNKHVISNVVISPVNDTEGTHNLSGFFTRIRNAEIRDLGLEIAYGGDTDFHNSALYWGGLAAEARDSHIERCYVSGTMETSYKATTDEDVYIGGFIAMADNSHIFDCYTDLQITFNANSSYKDTAVIAGFAAEFYNGHFDSSYSNSSVTVNGKAENDEIMLAGFVGYSFTPGNAPMFSSNLYNKDRLNVDINDAEELWGIQGKTSSELKDKHTYCDFNEALDKYFDNWDFWQTWQLDETVNDGFPHLGFTRKLAEFKAAEATINEEEKTVTIEYDLTKFTSTETKMFVTSFTNGQFAGVNVVDVDNTSKSGSAEIPYETKPDEVKILLWEDIMTLKPLAAKKEIEVK